MARMAVTLADRREARRVMDRLIERFALEGAPHERECIALLSRVLAAGEQAIVILDEGLVSLEEI